MYNSKDESINLIDEFKGQLYWFQNKEDPIGLSFKAVLQISLDYSNIQEYRRFQDWFEKGYP